MALNIFEVIRYEGEDTRNTLAWRHPNNNLKPGTTLIVNPGQRAVFFSNGNNTQFLSGLKSFVSGGVSPDSSFIWFVNMYDLQPIGWGTPSPILIRDPESQIPVELKSHGNFIPRIVDLEAFILEFMPSHPDKITAEVFQKRFRQAAIGIINSAVSQVVYNNKIAVIDIEKHTYDMALELSKILSNRFSKYGVSVAEFNIEALKVNQDSKGYKEIFEYHQRILTSKGNRDTYQEERKFDVLEEAAQNEGSAGNLMGAGMGLSMGLGLGAQFGNLMGTMGNTKLSGNQSNPNQSVSTEEVGLAKFCSQCGAAFSEGAKFCSNCGQAR